ncbi:MAG: glycosyltransferase [Lachnospiraceae bacterium]|nr:glycosyltransferase [Lachnospiraceae bacterium]
MTTSIRFNPIYFPVNRGHGDARRASLDACHNEWVALMDADDISLPNRFEKQLIAFSSNKTLDIVGGQIAEFIGTINNIIARRTVPENDGDIKSYAKKDAL